MATIFLESGTDATQDTSFWTITGTVASDSTVSFTGGHSLKLSTGSPAVSATATKTLVLADTGRRLSFRMRFDVAPAVTGVFLSMTQSGGPQVAALNLTTTGTINIAPLGATTVSGTRALNVNTWYRVVLAYTITNTTTFRFDLYINGFLEGSATAGTLTRITTSSLVFQAPSGFGTTRNLWVDDVYMDDGAAYGDPGNIIVTNKRPNANGAANQFTTQIGSGGSGYGTGHSPQVNEQPASTTNGWSIASASALTEEYTIEGAATGDKDVSNPRFVLVDYMGWILANSATGGTRNIVVNGSASNITTTTAAGGLIFLKAAGSTTYPSGNTAIGMNNNSVNNLTRLFECGILLAYKLPRRVSIS